MENAQR
jgi:hypothetical protein